MSRKKVKRARRRAEAAAQPIDVSGLRRLTSNEKAAQRCDPRSWVAEKSEWPWIPVAVAESHPNLGGRRLFVMAANRSWKNTRTLQRSSMHRPNMKAVHLFNCYVEWETVKRLRSNLMEGRAVGNGELQERVSCDLMCAATLSLYSFTAAIETFCSDLEDAGGVEAGKRRKASPVERVRKLLKERCGGRLPEHHSEFAALCRARNALTHSSSKGKATGAEQEFGQSESLGLAMETILRMEAGPAQVAVETMEMIAGRPSTRWSREVLGYAERHTTGSDRGLATTRGG